MALRAGTRARPHKVRGEDSELREGYIQRGKDSQWPALCHISFHSAKEGAAGTMGLQPCARRACGEERAQPQLAQTRRAPGEAASQEPIQKPRNWDQRERSRTQEDDSLGVGISGIFPAIPHRARRTGEKTTGRWAGSPGYSPRSLLFIIALDARSRGPCWVKW